MVPGGGDNAYITDLAQTSHKSKVLRVEKCVKVIVQINQFPGRYGAPLGYPNVWLHFFAQLMSLLPPVKNRNAIRKFNPLFYAPYLSDFKKIELF